MRKTISLIFFLSTVTACAGSNRYGNQTLGQPNQGRVVVPYASVGEVPRGTKLWLQLDHRIDFKHAKKGDTFAAHLVQEVEDQNGAIVIPRGAVVEGRIVEVGGSPKMARVRIESITIGSRSQPLFATIVRFGDRPTHFDGAFSIEPRVAAGTPVGIRIDQPIYGINAMSPFGVY